MTAPYPAGYQSVPDGGSPPASLGDAAERGWVQRIARAVTGLLQGKMNAVLPGVRLLDGATTTTIFDARISATSGLYLQPMTAHAGALLYGAPYVLVTTQKSGEVVFTHANTAFADQRFNLLIIG